MRLRKERMLFAVLLLFFFACRSKKESMSGEYVRMQIEPVQCLGNPWEQDWLEVHGMKYEDYPRGRPRQLEAEEKEIIRSFFEKEGIRIYKIEGIPFPDSVMVCDACDCPQGYTLEVWAAPGDTARLRTFGFKIFKETRNGE